MRSRNPQLPARWRRDQGDVHVRPPTRSWQTHGARQGTLPLALALLIAAVGSAILTMVAGTARISQLRRLARRRRD
jgi:hypothetical protein